MFSVAASVAAVSVQASGAAEEIEKKKDRLRSAKRRADKKVRKLEASEEPDAAVSVEARAELTRRTMDFNTFMLEHPGSRGPRAASAAAAPRRQRRRLNHQRTPAVAADQPAVQPAVEAADQPVVQPAVEAAYQQRQQQPATPSDDDIEVLGETPAAARSETDDEWPAAGQYRDGDWEPSDDDAVAQVEDSLQSAFDRLVCRRDGGTNYKGTYRDDVGTADCLVYQDPLKLRDVVFLYCGHAFHFDCLTGIMAAPAQQLTRGGQPGDALVRCPHCQEHFSHAKMRMRLHAVLCHMKERAETARSAEARIVAAVAEAKASYEAQLQGALDFARQLQATGRATAAVAPAADALVDDAGR
eukprot:TRINITY_DN372_c0_g1_i5.p1 TRINITY_DN372_c0_g1~~TRINITY_DN372_c0_g1_i5.p1  ORF type:complete len:357 (+),score=88.12 TRINITY_DN372_c0_g1_i5:139-1209(+)